MPQKTLYMENTQIAPEKTAREVSDLLVAFKARQISIEYTPEARISGLRFVLATAQGEVEFKLPVRVEPVYALLVARRKGFQNEKDKQRLRSQAERVAWRQLFRWAQAQLAMMTDTARRRNRALRALGVMIDTGMVAPQEVFLPYALHAGTGQTLYEFMEREGLKQLAAGGAG